MKKTALLFLIFLLLVSCSEGKTEDEDDAQAVKGVYPDLIMTGTTCRVGQSGSSPIILTADRMTLYSEDNYALLENFSFSSSTKDGEAETEGKADRGVIELDGSSITLTGNVSFSRPGDNMMITAENLVYDKEREEITTEGKVVVISDEGTFEGFDFKGDLKENLYSFSRIEKGDFTLE